MPELQGSASAHCSSGEDVAAGSDAPLVNHKTVTTQIGFSPEPVLCTPCYKHSLVGCRIFPGAQEGEETCCSCPALCLSQLEPATRGIFHLSALLNPRRYQKSLRGGLCVPGVEVMGIRAPHQQRIHESAAGFLTQLVFPFSCFLHCCNPWACSGLSGRRNVSKYLY